LLVTSKPKLVEVLGFALHDTPPLKVPQRGPRIITKDFEAWRGDQALTLCAAMLGSAFILTMFGYEGGHGGV
jgi:hypothetical protein